MTDSILNSTKKMCGIPEDYPAFDLDILTHINSVFSTLEELGVGPVGGYMIEGNTETWSQYLEGDNRLNKIKTYTYLRVRLLFDPPPTSFAIEAIEKQIKELEWRINVTVDDEVLEVPEVPSEDFFGDLILDP